MKKLVSYKCLAVFGWLFTCGQYSAQSPLGEQITPGGFFETVFDKEGKTYNIADLEIRLDHSNNQINVSSSYTCQAGFFKIYFDNNSGMAGSGATDVARRATICHLCENVSYLLGYNTTPTWPSNGYVKLLVDDINNQLISASSSSVLALGSSLYATPLNPYSPNPGIVQNQMQKTIISKVDAWTNVVNPLNTTASNGFYHGILSFNFANTTFTWNSVHTTTVSGQSDLYAIALHELTHTLGFVSLISSTGASKLGALNNYYGTYDKFLFNPGLSPLLTSTVSSPCNQQYGLSFSGGTLNLQPGCSLNYTPDVTTCSLACTYISANVPTVSLYTPGCFDGGGGTLSHFEDMCFPANTPSSNNQYFVMSNGTGSNIKRYLQDEERKVLCDLGYSVGTVYTSSATAASHTYNGSTSCTANAVWGVNDGILNSVLIFTSTGTPVSINFTSITSNDAPSVTPTCIETVYNTGTVTISGTVITFSPNSGYFGPFLLRYIPDNSGTQGNVTYIHGFIYPVSCNPASPCDMVQNGGFESRTGCGVLIGNVYANCWTPFTLSPDLFSRACTTSVLSANLGTTTYSSIISGTAQTPFDSHNPNNSNDAVIGLGAVLNANGLELSESCANFLGSPLLNNQTYKLSFWAYQFSGNKNDPLVGNGSVSQSYNPLGVPAVLNFATNNQYLPTGFNSFPVTQLVNTALTLTLTDIYNTWQYYSIPFTYTNASNGNMLYVGTDNIGTSLSFIGQAGALPASYVFYTLLDDISIKPIGQAVSFTLPNLQICSAQGYTNLGQYTSIPGGTFTAIGGGTFTSVGITTVAGVGGTEYNFNVPPTLPNGLYDISYTYVDANSCTQNVYQQVTIGNNFNNAVLNYSSSATCTLGGTLGVVSPTAGLSYTWQPGNINSYTAAVNPSVITVYTAAAISSSVCNITGTILVQPNIPTPTLAPTANLQCWGSTLTAVGNFTSINWSPGNLNSNPIIVSPSVATIYTAVVTSSLGCTGSQTVYVNAVNQSTLSITNISSTPCIGGQSTLTANNSYTFANNNVTYNWLPGSYTVNPVVVSPSVTTNYTVNLGNQWGCAATITTQVYVSNPSLSFSSNSLCPGYTASVAAIGNYTSIVWQPGGSTVSPLTFSVVNSPMTFSISTTYSNGCSSNQTFQIVPFDVYPSFSITSGYPVICSGTSETRTVTGTPSFTAVTWSPGSYTTNPAVITPTANTIYTVAVTLSVGCVYNYTSSAIVSTNCCSSSLTPMGIMTASSQTISGTGNSLNGNITIPSGSTLTLAGEIVFAPSVKIIVSPYAVLKVNDSHLYACGTTMWQGIEVLNLGAVYFSKQSSDNLIEDAVTAIDVSNHTSSALTILSLTNTTFNKNYVGINISNYQTTLTTYPFIINNCVFTCRNLPFTSTTWPQTGASSSVATSSADLRFPTSSTTGLAPPYLGQTNFTITNLKNPYSTQPSDWAIRLVNVGTTTSGNYNGIKIGDENSATNFNLFDGHRNFIYVWNSNLNSFNNVFQNTQYVNVSKHSYAGAAIFAYCNYTLNTNLNLSTPGTYSTNPDLGNRFWNCHSGVVNGNTYLFSAKYATFRSNQSTSGGSSYLPGNKGIYNVTSRFKYEISNNEFSNINTGIIFAANAGFYNMGSGNLMGIYANGLSINYNYFGPKTTTASSISNNEYTNHAILLTGGNQVNWASVPGTEIGINNNTIDRVYRGIYHSLGGGYRTKIMDNTIKLVNDNVFNQTQRGIELTGSLGNPLVKSNLLSGWSSTVTSKSLFYGSYNGGAKIICNDLSTCYQGFLFEGPDQGTFWRGNKMQSHLHGMELRTAGVIGAQGSSGHPIDNQWNGSWNGNYHTWTTGSATQASLSPLTVKTGTPWFAYNNNGDIQASSYNSNWIYTTTGSYTSCITQHANNLIVPSQGDYDSDDLKYSADNTLYRYLYFNDSIKNNAAGMSTFYTDLLNSSCDIFMQIEEVLYNGELTDARSLNSNVTATNTIETNYKTYYTLYANYADSSFRHTTADDSTDLYDLAQLCPNTNGSVIYQARALYLIVYSIADVYADECEEAGGDRLSNSVPTNSKIKSQWDVNIYPNPTTGLLNISSSKESELLNITIRDLSGRTVLTKSLKTRDFIANLDVSLINGAYFITIMNSKNEKVTKKLLVAK